MGISLAERLPMQILTRDHRIRAVTSAGHGLRLDLQPPLADSEVTNRDRQLLREHHAAGTIPAEDGVLFQCYRGEVATDSQLALHRELQRRTPQLSLYWGVADASAWLPPGAIPLLIGSREWHTKLASLTYLCNNVDFDGFFRKRPHQRYLQTFHGYPFKSMGRTFWRAKGFSPGWIERECARREADWDAILVPAEFCAAYYRNEYGYGGRILALGYPRTDALIGPTAPATREAVRERLGVSPEQILVLYAPTYRDTLTTATFAAKRFDALDLELLVRELGDRYVVLLRGHNNNQREPERVRDQATVIDVTDYPEINDLTLAADVALLDYSSLRFDWALTGKPMVFFAPDVDEYFAVRPPLFDFASSAPGPMVRTTADVADSLLDVEGVRSAFGSEIQAFNERFNALHDGHAAQRVADAFFS